MALITGTNSPETLTGSVGETNEIYGLAGDDTLIGAALADTLDGGSGADSMSGGTGDDRYVVDDPFDVVTELSGEGTADWVTTALTFYALPANVEKLTYTAATDGSDAYGNALPNYMELIKDAGYLGSIFGLFDWGNSGNSNDNDTLVGDGTDAWLEAGPGDDIYIVNDASQIVNEGTSIYDGLTPGGAQTPTPTDGAGIDTVSSFVTYALPSTSNTFGNPAATSGGNVENLVLITGAGAINGTGNELANVLTGNESPNSLSGGAANDTINGGAGNDTLVGEAGDDSMLGGLGDDTYMVDDALDSVDETGGDGTDTVSSSVNYDLSVPAAAGVENLVLTGTATTGTGNTLNNSLTGNAQANTLNGGGGNDVLDGLSGVDSMVGGAGDDTFFVDHTNDVVQENTSDGSDSVTSSVSYTLPANVENLTLTGAAIQGVGNSSHNLITGNDQNNVLDAVHGLTLGTGRDTLVGGVGDDHYIVDERTDTVTEFPGEGTADTITAHITFYLPNDVENLVLATTSGIGGYGNSAANTITGNSGGNLLNGYGGVDTLIGMGGDDRYYVDETNDVVTENPSAGTDRVYSTASSYTVPDNVEALYLQGTGITGIGNPANNIIQALTSALVNNTLDGGAGVDTLVGAYGNDTYFVDSASDYIIEYSNQGTDTVSSSATSYVLAGHVENLVLTGSNNINGTGNWLNNEITGNSGNNSLNGGSGNDTINGGASADILTGALGNDVFVFQAGQANGDVVTDFVGNGASAGDSLQFTGFTGFQSFEHTGGGVWRISYNGGVTTEDITLIGVTTLDPSDYSFV